MRAFQAPPTAVIVPVTSPVKAPWYVDLLNLNIDNHDLRRAIARIDGYMASFAHDGTRITANPDFTPGEAPR